MKKQDNSKRMLFEAMHKVTGMPLKEGEYDSPQEQNRQSNTSNLGFTAITKEKNPKEFEALKNVLGLEKMGSRITLPNGTNIMNQGDFQITFSSEEFGNIEYPDPPRAGSAPDERGDNW